MNNEELNRIIHSELIPIQNSFKSYQQLAGNGFHFSPEIFKKCIKNIQEVIEITRSLAKEE
jgi:hypothetical protein